MSGPLFMRPYQPHVAHIIKEVSETRGPTTPVPITDDAELVSVLRPNTIYIVKISLVFSAVSTGGIWRPVISSPVDFAALFTHRQVSVATGEQWLSASASDHWGDTIDTTRFNAPTNLSAAISSRVMHGVIKTGSGGGTLAIQWGAGNAARTLAAGSFMYLKEAAAY